MLQLIILPSPSPAIVISCYEKGAFPRFDPLFETPSASSPLHHIARDPQEASVSVVLENRSEKSITAWRYRWETLDVSGKRRTNTCSKDSYAVEVYRAIAELGSHQLISKTSGSVDETSTMFLPVGGLFTAKVGAESNLSFGDIVELSFEIQLVNVCRRRNRWPGSRWICDRTDMPKTCGGVYRSASSVGRDRGSRCSPVLSALTDTPSLRGPGRPQGDPLVHWIKRYAQDYLHNMHRKIGGVDVGEAALKYLPEPARSSEALSAPAP